jgi:hypothetical protein
VLGLLAELRRMNCWTIAEHAGDATPPAGPGTTPRPTCGAHIATAARFKNEAVARLFALPDHVIDLIDTRLKGQQLVPAGQTVTIARSRSHIAVVHAMVGKLGLPALLGPAGRHRDLALALVISRVVAPASKLATLGLVGRHDSGRRPGRGGASTVDIYTVMDWLASRQDAIERELARRLGRGRTGPDGGIRLVVLLAAGRAVPAGRPRLFPGRQERPTAD